MARTIGPLAGAALLLAACGGARPDPAPVAATYAATVPCAIDCTTVAYRITLFPDGTYWYERRHLGLDGQARHEFREVGRYAELDGTLTLHGTLAVPERWRRVTDAALRLVEGDATPGSGPATALTRQAQADRGFGPVRLRGVYRRDGLLATLRSCESGATYLVAGGAGLAELGLDYSRAVPREGAPLLVALEARFVAPAARRGAAATAPIMVEAFERSAPGASCDR